MNSKQHRRLRALIRRLGPIALSHIRIDIAGTAYIDQLLPAGVLLLPRQGLGASNAPRLARRVRRAREPGVLLLALLYGRREVAHDGCDVVFGLGREEAFAHRVRVLGQRAGGGADVHDAASGLEDGEEGAACEHGVVVICVEGLFDDVRVYGC